MVRMAGKRKKEATIIPFPKHMAIQRTISIYMYIRPMVSTGVTVEFPFVVFRCWNGNIVVVLNKDTFQDSHVVKSMLTENGFSMILFQTNYVEFYNVWH